MKVTKENQATVKVDGYDFMKWAASFLPAERKCCGTFVGSPHRATCAKYRGKGKGKK